ncbi:hypothetical protein ABZP36_027014 [Zizania latifolia]
MEKGDETLASPTPTAAAEETTPIGGEAGDEITVTVDGHPAKSYAAVVADKTSLDSSVAEDEATVTTAENPVRSYADVATENPAMSYADVAAEKTSANGNVPEDEVTVTASENPAKSDVTVAAEKTAPNGSVAEDEVTDTTTVNLAKSYATVMEDVATAEYSAASSDKEVVSLREEIKQLQDLLKAENGDHETDKCSSEQLAGKVGFVRQVKVRLQGEIKDLQEKAAAAAPTDEIEAAPMSGASKEAGFAWPGMAGAAAAGAVAAAVGVLLYLRLKR